MNICAHSQKCVPFSVNKIHCPNSLKRKAEISRKKNKRGEKQEREFDKGKYSRKIKITRKKGIKSLD